MALFVNGDLAGTAEVRQRQGLKTNWGPVALGCSKEKTGGPPDFEGLDDESKVPLRKVLMGEGDSITYTYDFGDNWRHKVLLEKVLTGRSLSRPVCVDGRRRRPPEDVGGPSGYEEFLNVTFEPGHEESERYRQWGGGTFHAEEFDLKVVNDALESMRWPAKHGR